MKSIIAMHFRKKAARLAAKMDSLGAETYPQYVFFRIRRLIRSFLCVVGPRVLRARLRQRKYAQIIPLGMNCEIAFRFYCRWGFVDSAPFAWAASKSLAILVDALKNLDSLSGDRFEIVERTHMWKDIDRNIDFHGALQWKIGAPLPDKAVLDADLADLRGRLSHLTAKLRRYLSNDERTLLAYRLSDEDACAPDLAARLKSLENALTALGAKNCTLLVVCRRRDLAKMPPETPCRIYRTVREFNPGNRVSWKDIGDPVGWHAIFTEFAPAKILPKAHAFKFE